MKRNDNRLSGRLDRLASLSLRLTESATDVAVRETGRMLEASTSAAGKTTRPIQIITPGWGSSGYYSASVLEKAATDKVIPAGTHMYLNHASATEAHDRPERDVEKIAAVLTEDAVWDGTGLRSVAELIGPHAELIESLAPYIGVSIDGSATDITIGEAEGRTGRIIEGLAHVDSVDFVTHAGRGGAILLESARPSVVVARAVEHGVTEATANDMREQLQGLLRDTFGADQTWIWVRDFDDELVWYEHELVDSYSTFQIAYERGEDGNVTALSGTPVEVRASTTYVPVARPDDTPTTESKEGTVEIDDNELAALREKAGRADQLAAQLAESTRKSAASDLLKTKATEAKVAFTPLETTGLLTMIEAKDDGSLDADAFTKLVEAEVEAKKTALTEAAAGTGRPSGFGESAEPDTKTTESGPRTKNAWGRPLTEKASA